MEGFAFLTSDDAQDWWFSVLGFYNYLQISAADHLRNRLCREGRAGFWALCWLLVEVFVASFEAWSFGPQGWGSYCPTRPGNVEAWKITNVTRVFLSSA